MLGSQAVQAVYDYLKENISGVNIYKYKKGKSETGEYIAVNNLPFIFDDAIGKGEVNINIHVPQLRTELPNIKRLDTLAIDVAALFSQTVYLSGAYFDLSTDSRPTEDTDSTYYVNIRLKVTFNNLKK